MDTFTLKKSDYFYELPEELIAQDPLTDRSSSRLMVLDRKGGGITHGHFTDILKYLEKGDCLVINNTKVIPARLIGTRETQQNGLMGQSPDRAFDQSSGKEETVADTEKKAPIEVLLLKRLDANRWEAIVKPGKKLRAGARVSFGGGLLKGEIEEVKDDGNRIVRFEFEGIFEELLDKLGTMPLPPYITHKLENPERYNTVYARFEGSAAAPTAGLHFTRELLEQVRDMGVEIAEVTLHVGLGTFRPVKEDNILDHKMHSEYFVVPQEAADIINRTKRTGHRVICVGTTSCRTVEAAASGKYVDTTITERSIEGGVEENIGENADTGCCGMRPGKSEKEDNAYISPCSGDTDIFIYPGYEFRICDCLITNFHLPESTLIMLVSALAGREHVLEAYREAVKERYRFFSFGDAMFIK
ncbi:MAG: tRNA preQ1(34) S-adenosylmethionine ribosyltransferase-isomerase QueA [Lachnospiraceae bacterium]|nr:tRNA preQ1(34) S-adenosylmethionine ribosyltransferase-isomerase QueA [Lachnospiraceae bacterium]